MKRARTFAERAVSHRTCARCGEPWIGVEHSPCGDDPTMREPVRRTGWHVGAHHGALDLYGADGALLGTVAWNFARRRWDVVAGGNVATPRYTLTGAMRGVEDATGFGEPARRTARWVRDVDRDELRDECGAVIGYVRSRGRRWIGCAGRMVLSECEDRDEAGERLAAILGVTV